MTDLGDPNGYAVVEYEICEHSTDFTPQVGGMLVGVHFDPDMHENDDPGWRLLVLYPK